jgi:hypothetical protein
MFANVSFAFARYNNVNVIEVYRDIMYYSVGFLCESGFGSWRLYWFIADPTVFSGRTVFVSFLA